MWIRFDYKNRMGHASSYFTHIQTAWHLKDLLDRLGVEFEDMQRVEADGRAVTLDQLRELFKERRRGHGKAAQ